MSCVATLLALPLILGGDVNFVDRGGTPLRSIKQSHRRCTLLKRGIPVFVFVFRIREFSCQNTRCEAAKTIASQMLHHGKGGIHGFCVHFQVQGQAEGLE